MLIDTHCHLNDEKLIEREDSIVGSFGTDGIECAVCVGYDLPSSVLARDIASRHDSVYFAPGIHPHDSDTADDEKYAVKNGKVVRVKVVADCIADALKKAKEMFMKKLEESKFKIFMYETAAE